MALTAPQLEILHALIKLCNAREGRGVRSSELARYLGKHEVSVRRILSVMKGLGLVQSRVGPGGGYLPTLKAFELVKSPPIPIDMGSLRLVKDGTRTEITAMLCLPLVQAHIAFWHPYPQFWPLIRAQLC
ncbi:MAG: Rrf2 family transcriptional regulator [Candidatus Methanodesulfokora sp.]|nr:MAG: hypothetical protein C0200_04775 [Candidatus Korarchaeota archaeon]